MVIQEQEIQEEEEVDLNEEFVKRIVGAARSGTQNGFIIKMGRRTGNKVTDPLGEGVEEIVYDQEKRFYKHSMSTQDYKRYLDAKDRLAKETDESKRIDLTLRMYEYLALKFLGMTHDEFVSADFDDIVVATLACDALFGSGNPTTTTTTLTPQQQEKPLVRRRPVKQLDAYYKAPDEE